MESVIMRKVMAIFLLFAALTAIWAAPNSASGMAVEMIPVEGGSFIMGIDSDDEWCMDSPSHEVFVAPFHISAHEVTQKEWQDVMGFNPSLHPGNYFPVENVSWGEAIEYCNRRSQMEGLNPAYSFSFAESRIICDWRSNGYRLPTEAEWEYAAKGGNKDKDYLFSGSNNIKIVAWTRENAYGETHEVGTRLPNQLGIYDLTGNVWEWCWDDYLWYRDQTEYNPRDETRHFSGNFRGGSFTNTPEESLNTFRGYGPHKKFNIGFRVVRSSI
jgi:formylglycine-generating enzyme required for sulfatase activity